MFALSHGHTEECVEHSIQALISTLNHICMNFQVPLEEVLVQMGADAIEDRLAKILEEKDCDCLKQESLH